MQWATASVFVRRRGARGLCTAYASLLQRDAIVQCEPIFIIEFWLKAGSRCDWMGRRLRLGVVHLCSPSSMLV